MNKSTYKIAVLGAGYSASDASFVQIEVDSNKNIEAAVSQFLLHQICDDASEITDEFRAEFENDSWIDALLSGTCFSHEDVGFSVNEEETMAWVEVYDDATLIITKIK